MSDRLARSTAFALEAEEAYDEVPEQSPRQQLTNLRRLAMRRPDRLVGDATGDALNRSFWYDGKTFSALDKEQYVWASGAVLPPPQGASMRFVVPEGTVVVVRLAADVSSATPAQSPQAFTLAVPLTVEIMTGVAVS